MNQRNLDADQEFTLHKFLKTLLQPASDLPRTREDHWKQDLVKVKKKKEKKKAAFYDEKGNDKRMKKIL